MCTIAGRHASERQADKFETPKLAGHRDPTHTSLRSFAVLDLTSPIKSSMENCHTPKPATVSKSRRGDSTNSKSAGLGFTDSRLGEHTNTFVALSRRQRWSTIVSLVSGAYTAGNGQSMTLFRNQASKFNSVMCPVACRQTEARLPV